MHNCNIIATSLDNNSTVTVLRLDSALIPSSSSASLGKLGSSCPTPYLTGNLVPHCWYKTFTTTSGRPDAALISILSEIVYWHRPSKAGSSKFTTDAWQTSYDYFESRFGYSRETIRRVFVKLEALGVASRELRMVKSFGQKYNNVLFVHLNSDKLYSLTKAYNFKSCPAKPVVNRIKLDDATEIELKICDVESKKTCFSSPKKYTPSPQIVIGHIEEENILENNKIRTDLGISNSANSGFPESNLEIEATKLNQITEKVIEEQKNESVEEKALNQASSSKPNEQKSRKPLSSFHPLSEIDAITLRKNSGRPFTLGFINKLLLKLSDQYPSHGFYTKELLLSYLTVALRGEKYDATIANRDTFYFKPKEGTPQHQKILQHNYLKAIEQSLQTDPTTRIKRKIIGLTAGDDEYAYHIITNCSLPYIPNNYGISNNNTEDSSQSKHLTTHTIKISSDITQDQKEIITKATKEVLGIQTNIIFKDKENTSNDCSTNLEGKTTHLEPLTPSSPLWQKIRSLLKERFGDKGEALDQSWFSKLDIELQGGQEANTGCTNTSSNTSNTSDEDNARNQIKIKCSTPFMRDWIKTNYGNAIENATEHAIGQFAEVEYVSC